MKQSRREFLELFSKTAGCSLATASLLPLASCSLPRSGASAYRFPQGVASADPQPDGILLWTRVVSEDVNTEAIELRVQLVRDEDFSEVLLDQQVLAEKDLDFTVRCFVDGLEPDGRYFYRFLSPDGGVSRIGRTRTAPSEEAETILTVGVCSCQHYARGFFSAYRRMLLDDQQAPEAVGEGKSDRGHKVRGRRRVGVVKDDVRQRQRELRVGERQVEDNESVSAA